MIRRLKSFFGRVRRWFNREHTIECVRFSVTLVAAWWVTSLFVAPWQVVMILSVVVAHELGHYISGIVRHQDAKMPFFVPFGPAVAGLTRVSGKRWDRDPFEMTYIAMAGPYVGTVVASSLLVGCALFGFIPGVYTAGWLLLAELFRGTIGADARKYRRWKREQVAITVEPASLAAV